MYYRIFKRTRTKQEQEKQHKKRLPKKLRRAEEFLRKLKEDLNRLEKHQYSDNEDLDYKGIRQIEIYLIQLTKTITSQ